MKKNLVIMPFGKKSLYSDWFTPDTVRNFDVVLLGYHTIQDLSITANPGIKVRHYYSYKWWMVKDFFDEHEEYLNHYSAFFFLDDDIEINKNQIINLFNCFNSLPLQLGQPSLTYDSHMSWHALRHRKLSGMRYVTSVELMCPLMKQEALKKLLSTFKLTQSGWGIDLLWGKKIVKLFGSLKIAVIDIIQVRHTKPVGLGELYEKLEQPAKQEEDAIRADYDLKTFRIKEVRSIWNTLPGKLITFIKLKKFEA
ncbi:MAG: hypothetical protein J0L66_12715 [Cytophagales bacterium]|nr:hypothetical protein [Cytophagales bacterium]